MREECSSVESRIWEIFEGDELRFWDRWESLAEDYVDAIKGCDIEKLKCIAPYIVWISATTTFYSTIYDIIMEHLARIGADLLTMRGEGGEAALLARTYLYDDIRDIVSVMLFFEEINADATDMLALSSVKPILSRIVSCLIAAGANPRELPSWLIENTNFAMDRPDRI